MENDNDNEYDISCGTMLQLLFDFSTLSDFLNYGFVFAPSQILPKIYFASKQYFHNDFF
jgi:hypothetical protein